MRWTDTSLYREVTRQHEFTRAGAFIDYHYGIQVQICEAGVYSFMIVCVCLCVRQDLYSNFVDLEQRCVVYNMWSWVSERRDCDDPAAYICQTLDDANDGGKSVPCYLPFV